MGTAVTLAAGHGAAGESTPAGATPGKSAARTYLYHHIRPNIVYKGDAETTLTVEVATTGEDIAEVRIESPVTLAMRDDGTGGDTSAGDGVYTARGVEHRTEYSQVGFGGTP